MRRILVLGVISAFALAGMTLRANAADFDPLAHLVRDIQPGSQGSDIVKSYGPGASLGTKIVFGAFDGNVEGPWVSNGTHNGTKLLSSVAGNPTSFTTFAGRVYFAATSVADGRELWKTDGTVAGTVEVADIYNSGSSNPTNLTVVGNYLYFAASPVGSGQDVYRLPAPPAIGPPQPPQKISNFGGSFGIQNMAAFGSKVLFGSTAGGGGFEPWVSDGTLAGTVPLGNLMAGAASSNPDWFTTVGSKAYFQADGADGVELFSTNGTALGTSQVADLNPGTAGSIPRDLFKFGSKVLFRASQGSNDVLWYVDGTGIHKLAGVRGGGTGSDSTGWTYYKNYVYFSGSTPSNGSELYRTKGVTGDLTLVKSINPGTTNSSPQEFRVVAGRLYFNATDATHGAELWRSDGTANSTVPVKDINPGTANSYPLVVAVANATLFFSAADPTHGSELWGYTVRTSTTKGYPPSSYTLANATALKLHLKVKVTASGYTPSGTVTLKKGSTVIGTGTLSNGTALVHITVKLPKGTTMVRAVYSGSLGASSSHSDLISVKVV